MRHGLRRKLREFHGIDADREYGGAGAAVMRTHHAVTHGKAEIVLDIGQEVLAILFGLETDEVVGQHRLDQLAMVRHAADQGARRPGRMQEEANRLGHTEIAQLRPERQEMIILHPEHGVGLAEAHQRARHEGVHFAIGNIVRLRRADQVGARMQRRPQRRIGKTFVIAAVMRRGQIEHRQRTGAQRLDFGKRFLQVPVADTARRPDPDRAGMFHHRQQRRCQPPGHGLIGFSARDAV
jgi:hypothetical protein